MPSGLSTESLQQQGQKLYQRGDFNASLETFTEALKSAPTDLKVSLLDNRAATCTKLAQYDMALRDARHMIKQDKNDERGYLRCAKVLILDGKPDKALDVYAYALKTLSSNHPRRQVVEQLHNKLRDKMSEKCHDPFTVLPFEVAELILQQFNFRQIVAILRVSKKWDQFLSSIRSFWMRLDLTGARKRVHWTAVRSYIRRSKAMLTCAIVENLNPPSIPKSLEFLSRCPNLEYLDVRVPVKANELYDLFKNSKKLKTLITFRDIVVPHEIVLKFLTDLPLIERVEIFNTRSSPLRNAKWPQTLPNLKYLTICAKEMVRSGLYSMCNLEGLRLIWSPDTHQSYPVDLNPMGLPRLRRVEISGMDFHHLEIPPSVEYFRVHGGTSHSSRPFSAANTSLQRLSTLILIDVVWAKLSTLQLLLRDGEVPLRVLHLDCCFGLTGPELVEFSQTGKLDSLTELNVQNMPGVDDRIVETLTSRMPDLKVLNLSATGVTGVTIKKLVDARASPGPNTIKISRLYVKNCEEVSWDAITYGRGRGIEIFLQ
ncbi:hypothetical protein PHISCL_01814 [Aspergillus sclerotialis]|uniref:F-box domain-containing protein n=1 Tax=Aspergillus sclerotialis TaxID=2070753 RepID=A0A3A2ZRS5_9EURO|nr:hypothetical protein PHISCL_01814 [Aspergillus sclerotialis]